MKMISHADNDKIKFIEAIIINTVECTVLSSAKGGWEGQRKLVHIEVESHY